MFRKNKNILLVFCAVSSSILSFGDIHALANQPHIEPLVVHSKDTVNEIQSVDNYAKLLTMGADVRSLQLNNVAIIDSTDSKNIECQITWRYDEFDSTSSGRKELFGDIVLPEGFNIANSPIQVSQIIYVYSEEDEFSTAITSISIGNDNDISILIPEGTPEEILPSYFQNLDKQATITTEYGDILLVDYTIDYNQIPSIGLCMPIDLQIPSSFLISTTAEYNISVCVIENDIIYFESLNTWDDGYLITWLYDAKDIKLLVNVDGEGWIRYKDANPYGATIIKLNDRSHGNIYGLYIPTSALEQGKYYQFQLEYNNRKYSNIAGFNLFYEELDIFFFPDFGGDRPGGDREEVEDPEINEKPEIPLYGNNKETVAPLQIDGNQLTAMAQANPIYTTFLIDNIKVSLPSNFLKSLSLKKTDKFYIDFKQNGHMSFSLHIYVNGILITDFPSEAILIHVPWAFSSASFIDEDGNTITFTLENGIGTFSLYRFGYFQSTDSSSLMKGENESEIMGANNTILSKSKLYIDSTPPKNIENSNDLLNPMAIALIIVLISIGLSTFMWQKKRDS